MDISRGNLLLPQPRLRIYNELPRYMDWGLPNTLGPKWVNNLDIFYEGTPF